LVFFKKKKEKQKEFSSSSPQIFDGGELLAEEFHFVLAKEVHVEWTGLTGRSQRFHIVEGIFEGTEFLIHEERHG